MKRIVFFIGFTLITFNNFSQQSDNSWSKEHLDFGGYVKYLNSVNFHNADDLMTDNIIHNRLNLKVYFNDYFVFNTSIRNRIFYGDMLKNPFFSTTALDKDNGIIDLTFLPVKANNLIMQSTFDRLNLDFNYKKWNIIFGRQRINWGINSVWNPNDLFNSSNFLDFDYEEKPGADALRISYETGEMSNFEIAYTTDKNFQKKNSIIAGKYTFHYKSYDYQVIAGKYLEDYSLGIGWAGNIKNLGFKGEQNIYINDSTTFVSSISLDYAFKNGISWMISGLYNGSFNKNNAQQLLSLFSSKLNAKNLFPSKYTFYNGFSGNFGPAWTWGFAGIYATENKFFILIPQISYNIKDNWEISIYSQSFFADIPQIEQRNIIFGRLRWSF